MLKWKEFLIKITDFYPFFLEGINTFVEIKCVVEILVDFGPLSFIWIIPRPILGFMDQLWPSWTLSFAFFGPFLISFDRIGPLIVPDSPKEKTIFQTVSRGQISSDGTKSHTRIDENWAKIDTLYRKSIWLHIIGIDAHFCYGLNVINKFYCCTLWLRYN